VLGQRSNLQPHWWVSDQGENIERKRQITYGSWWAVAMEPTYMYCELNVPDSMSASWTKEWPGKKYPSPFYQIFFLVPSILRDTLIVGVAVVK
jgi:hypothetical protein